MHADQPFWPKIFSLLYLGSTRAERTQKSCTVSQMAQLIVGSAVGRLQNKSWWYARVIHLCTLTSKEHLLKLHGFISIMVWIWSFLKSKHKGFNDPAPKIPFTKSLANERDIPCALSVHKVADKWTRHSGCFICWAKYLWANFVKSIPWLLSGRTVLNRVQASWTLCTAMKLSNLFLSCN